MNERRQILNPTVAPEGDGVEAAPVQARRSLRRIQIATLLGVLGPGLIAGLSDDDPAGITTYSVLGTK